jgi:hypothetical protein
MQKMGLQLRFGASDLVGHLDCHHLTALDAAVARGTAVKPKIWDPVLETLAERGRAHERSRTEIPCRILVRSANPEASYYARRA